MSRKDYELITKVIREAKEDASYEEGRIAVWRVANGLSYALALDNPRFDRERFMQACGFEE